jgi:uncharacterized protein with GYD domain
MARSIQDNVPVKRRNVMPKYLIHASYTADGAKGLLKDGGSKRREAARAVLKSAGATLEQFYYALGEADAIVIADAPDHATIVGAAVAINASGAVTIKTTALMTAEEMDQAVKKNVSYTPPGQ